MTGLIPILLTLATAQTPPMQLAEYKPHMEATYSVDTRSFDNLNLLATGKLPFGFSYYGFVDISSDGVQPGTDEYFDPENYFSRWQLNKNLWKGLGVEVEHDASNLPPGVAEVARFGLTYRHDFRVPWSESKAFAIGKIFPVETDNSGGKTAFVWNVPITRHGSIWTDGFFDVHLNKDATDKIVFEPQLNFRINRYFDLVIEGRYNGFLDGNDDTGVGVGLRIKLD